MEYNFKIMTDPSGRMMSSIPWWQLQNEGDVLVIAGPEDFDSTVRTSASRFGKKNSSKISVARHKDTWECTLRSANFRKVSPYLAITQMDVGDVMKLRWTWIGGGDNPPEFRMIRYYYLKAQRLGFEMEWKMWDRADGVTIKRTR